jgi:peptide/nickel transport system substrate-binding protein
VPNLAAEIPTKENGGISADGKIFKVKLKRDVKWSDGQPLTAKDIEFTYLTVINPAVPVRSRSGFDLIKNFKAVDAQTIEMELSKPYVPFMWAWQNMHIVPHHLLKDEKDLKTSAWNNQPVGSGPFLLKQRVAGSHMVYERNPNYHRGPAKVRQFIHKFVPDQTVLFGQIRTGEVDFLGTQGVPNARWAEAKDIKERVFFPNPMPFVQFIYFNCGKPQFADPKVRKALYIACEMKKSSTTSTSAPGTGRFPICIRRTGPTIRTSRTRRPTASSPPRCSTRRDGRSAPTASAPRTACS